MLYPIELRVPGLYGQISFHSLQISRRFARHRSSLAHELVVTSVLPFPRARRKASTPVPRHRRRAGLRAEFRPRRSGRVQSSSGSGSGTRTHGQRHRRQSARGGSGDWGGIVQVAYLITPQWEEFGRYNVLRLDRDPSAGGNDTFHEVTVGVDYYLGPDGSFGHRAKFTLDLTCLPDGGHLPTRRSVLASDEDEWVLRGQFQLLLKFNVTGGSTATSQAGMSCVNRPSA